MPLTGHGQRCPARHRGELAREVRVFVPEESGSLPEESGFLPEESGFFPQLRANATTERHMCKPPKGAQACSPGWSVAQPGVRMATVMSNPGGVEAFSPGWSAAQPGVRMATTRSNPGGVAERERGRCPRWPMCPEGSSVEDATESCDSHPPPLPGLICVLAPGSHGLAPVAKCPCP